jgi:hypothetical protein
MSMNIVLHVCPLCSKTLVDHSRQWEQMDVAVAQTPMPEELLNKTVTILCNDCETKGPAPYHVLGFKCANSKCGGYNTRQIMDEAANYTLLYRDPNYSTMLRQAAASIAQSERADVDSRGVVAGEDWGSLGAVDGGVGGDLGRDGGGGDEDGAHQGSPGLKDTAQGKGGRE